MLALELPGVRLTVDKLHVKLELAGRAVVDGLWPNVQDAPALRALAKKNETIRKIVEVLDRSYREVCE